tara:strand:- start:11456 stop:13291 length:1836 start_codon:yes stop_codon:yes gene_type:complete
MEQKLKIFRAWLKKAGLQEKPHQIAGLKFCFEREAPCGYPDIRGGILADEMGLGKTIIMLGTIICGMAVASKEKLPTLVVLPKALLHQWTNIFQKFFKYTPVVYHGTNCKNISKDELKKSSIVVTTYAMISKGIRRDQKNFEDFTPTSPLQFIKWGRVIMDEAHHIRNKTTTNFKGALCLKRNITWLVTGTPIQNKSEDFYSLCSVLGLSDSSFENLESCRKTIKKYVLRRTKKSVGIKLPPLNTQEVVVPWMSLSERDLAAQLHSKNSFSNVTVDNVDEAIDELSKGALPLLTRTRQVCVNPNLLKTALKKLQRNEVVSRNVSLGDIHTTSKAQAIVDHIGGRRENGKRKIVFCHYRGEIDLIKNLLKKMDISSATFDGRTTDKERGFISDYVVSQGEFSLVCKKWRDKSNEVFPIVDSFMCPSVLIMQIQTACEGLNLQHFQEIYFSSPHWNPSVEDQAVARAHRINQKEEVNVFRFIMEDFVAENEDEQAAFEEEENYGAGITLDKYCQLVQNTKREQMHMITGHETPYKRNDKKDKKDTKKQKLVFKRKRNKNETGGSKCSKNCCICLEKISKEKSVALPCAHVFHGDCINKWLSVNSCCPLCKTRV